MRANKPSLGIFKAKHGVPPVAKKTEKLKTLNGRLPLEDSSNFDDFWTELILMTRSIIWDIFRFSQFVSCRAIVGRCSDGRRTAVLWSLDVCFRTKILIFKFQISIGQGWGTAVPSRPSEPSRPSPGQLKFEI